jgi:flagellar export protein FliJ
MKAFAFSLQSVWDAKQARYAQAEQELVAALREGEDIKGRMQTLQGEVREQIGRVSEQRGVTALAGQLRADLRYLETLHETLEALAQRLVAQEQEIEQRRLALQTVWRECKSLEHACDRERAAWLQETRRTEQKQTDDVAVMAFWRRQADGSGALPGLSEGRAV